VLKLRDVVLVVAQQQLQQYIGFMLGVPQVNNQNNFESIITIFSVICSLSLHQMHFKTAEATMQVAVVAQQQLQQYISVMLGVHQVNKPSHFEFVHTV
jgi:pectin methylesterase-like acyl-CoA thioesterase